MNMNISKNFLVLMSAATVFACQPKSDTINNYFDSGKVTEQKDEMVEGTINGGGGKGIRCVDPVSRKTTLQLLDLYEAQVLYGLEMLTSPAGSNEALDLMADLMGRHFWNPSTIDIGEFKKLRGDPCGLHRGKVARTRTPRKTT